MVSGRYTELQGICKKERNPACDPLTIARKTALFVKPEFLADRTGHKRSALFNLCDLQRLQSDVLNTAN